MNEAKSDEQLGRFPNYLPGPVEVAVLTDLYVLGSEQLPSFAACWLASDVADSEAVRELAGENPGETWSLHRLLEQVLADLKAVVPTDAASRRLILMQWVTSRWLGDNDTENAIQTLARVNRTEPDFDLGDFAGLASEWTGGWGRPIPEVRADAEETLQAQSRITN